MARRVELNWDSFQYGEDSAKSAIDPLSIANGFCSVMQNIEPSVGRLAPRYGCSIVADGFGNIVWMGEYQKAGSGYTLVKDGSDLWSVSYPDGSKRLVRKNWFSSNRKISSVRAGKYLILVVDESGLSMVIYERDGSLVWMDATLDNTLNPVLSLEARPDIRYEGDEMRFLASGPRIITYSWVRLDDQYASQTYTVDTGMPSAQLESWENIDNRSFVQAYKTGVTESTGDFYGHLYVSLDNSSAPSGATHIRIYSTLSAPVTGMDYDAANKKAAGLVLRWLCDIPVSDMPTVDVLPGSDQQLMGSTNLAWSTGRDDIPPGGWVKFANGRLWVGGSVCQGISDNPGRVYFSAIMDGATEQLSRLLSFAYKTDYVDTSTDESEPCVGAGISNGDLILFNPRSVYLLKDSNPDYAPQHISNLGAVGAITEINQRIMYLSINGPATVSGSVVEDLPGFKSVRAVPRIRGYSDFHSASRLNGIWHNDSWIISDGVHSACYLMRGDDRGTWSFEPGVPMSLLNSSFPVKDICIVGGGGRPLYRLMDPSSTLDGNKPFLAKLYTNGTKVPKGYDCGEAYSIMTGASWGDSSQIKTVVLGDHGRLADIFEFENWQGTGGSDVVPLEQRGPVLQGVQDGAVSHWFQCGVEKYIWGDTLFGPIALEVIPRNYRVESFSISNPARPEPILDSGYYGWNPTEEVG